MSSALAESNRIVVTGGSDPSATGMYYRAATLPWMACSLPSNKWTNAAGYFMAASDLGSWRIHNSTTQDLFYLYPDSQGCALDPTGTTWQLGMYGSNPVPAAAVYAADEPAPVVPSGWNTNAWPCTNFYRLTGTNFVSTTDLWANVHTEVWFQQQNTTNPIPVLPLDGTYFSPDVYLWPLVYALPIPGFTGSVRQWTNTYLTSIAPTQPTNWPYNPPLDIPAGYAFTNFHTNVSGTVTSVLLTVVSGTWARISTQLTLNVQDLWSVEAYLAYRERWRVATTSTNEEPPYRGPFLYRRPNDLRGSGFGALRPSPDSLMEWKIQISSVLSSFVNVASASNSPDGFNAYFAADTNRVTFPTWTGTGLLACVNAPSNYFSYTPFRALGGWNTRPLERVTTGEWVFAVWRSRPTDFSNRLSYSCDTASYVWDPAYGDAMRQTGTNWYSIRTDTNALGAVTQSTLRLWVADGAGISTQLVASASCSTCANAVVTNVFVCTNDWIAAGFTENDYGYKYVQAICSQLVWTAGYDGHSRVYQKFQEYGTHGGAGNFGISNLEDICSLPCAALWEYDVTNAWSSEQLLWSAAREFVIGPNFITWETNMAKGESSLHKTMFRHASPYWPNLVPIIEPYRSVLEDKSEEHTEGEFTGFVAACTASFRTNEPTMFYVGPIESSPDVLSGTNWVVSAWYSNFWTDGDCAFCSGWDASYMTTYQTEDSIVFWCDESETNGNLYEWYQAGVPSLGGSEAIVYYDLRLANLLRWDTTNGFRYR